MNARLLLIIACASSLVACRDEAEKVVTEVREPTTRDIDPKLFASSDERFRNAKPSPVKGVAPKSWRSLPASQFRLLNYRFGESGLGEVWVSLASGGVAENVNRWLTQFGQPALSTGEFQSLRQVPIAGTTGVWVEAAGDYAAGMGSPPRPGYGLAGVITSVNHQILTVKMVGPKAEVESARAELEAFAATLQLK